MSDIVKLWRLRRRSEGPSSQRWPEPGAGGTNDTTWNTQSGKGCLGRELCGTNGLSVKDFKAESILLPKLKYKCGAFLKTRSHLQQIFAESYSHDWRGSGRWITVGQTISAHGKPTIHHSISVAAVPQRGALQQDPPEMCPERKSRHDYQPSPAPVSRGCSQIQAETFGAGQAWGSALHSPVSLRPLSVKFA